MTRFILRWAINAAALFAAIAILPGIELPAGASWVSLIWLALIFGLINALFRPLIKFLTCPLIILTLGLFVLVINTLLFALTGWIGQQFGVGFILADPWFWNAFLGALITSLISLVLTAILKDELKKK
jgi:putative membrane protein